MSKRGKRTARQIIRYLGGVRTLRRALLSDEYTPETKAWIETVFSRYYASEKRRKARAAKKEFLHGARFSGPAAPPPAPTFKYEIRKGKEIRTLVEPPPEPKPYRGLVDPITTRDGIRPKTYPSKRRSPRTGLAKFGKSLL